MKHEVNRPDDRGVLSGEHPAVVVDAIHLAPSFVAARKRLGTLLSEIPTLLGIGLIVIWTVWLLIAANRKTTAPLAETTSDTTT